MLKQNLKYFCLILIGLNAACSDYALDGKKVENTVVVELAVDEVKLISSSISNPNETSTFYTSEYVLHPNAKLLMRLGSLKTQTAKIVIEQPVLFRVSVKQDSGNSVNEKLRLCPIMSEWMMGATWFKPQRNNKKWMAEGGDFDMSNCLLPLKKDDPIFDAQHLEEKQYCSGSDVICYDIKIYINAYIRTRNIDYGFALISSELQGITLYGDRTTRGPEILWRKIKW